jgi:hypothetical protein
MDRRSAGYRLGMTDSPDSQTPVERLREHLDEVDEKPDQMQERLDELGDNIEATRRRAEADDLLPTEDGEDTDTPVGDLDWPEGDDDVETPVTDSDLPPGG